MARYVYGFVIPVPSDVENKPSAQKSGKSCASLGSRFRECVCEDLKVKGIVPFTRNARAKAGETGLSWIVFTCARTRSLNKKHEEPRIANMRSRRTAVDVKRKVYVVKVLGTSERSCAGGSDLRPDHRS